LLLLLTVLGAVIMKGNPFFTQLRPGKNERIFRLVKFRTMTCETDADGNPLPDEQRLVPYGKFLRSTSLDELPELFNILKGDMAIVGPRPLLVRDMVFMTSEQRRRHAVRQGLTGLAQVNGRNAMTWEQKLDYDLQYVRDISFRRDLQIVLKTVMKVLQRDGITEEGQATAMDFGDSLLHDGKISLETYNLGQAETRKLLMKTAF
jgi:lipopolysaccharide/colanic/teichoic acid biosynthesis glycosyltransferase